MNNITSLIRRTATAGQLIENADNLGFTVAVLMNDDKAIVQMSHPAFGRQSFPVEFTFTWTVAGKPELESAEVYQSFPDLEAAVVWAVEVEIDNFVVLNGE